MTELDQLIATAYKTEGKQEAVNKVYLTLLRSPLYVPVEKRVNPSDVSSDLETDADAEPFKPLFAKVDNRFFILAFDTVDRLTQWAGEEFNQLDYVELSGRDLIAGVGDQVYLCINLGSDYYKEFSPDEIKQLKTIVSRIEQLRGEV